ncbi:multisensor hybrid histidine kinase, partial [Acanthamoeba castellanii str. Neff]
RIREKDWSHTPFGPIENWPTCLKVALDIALPSQFPIVIFWGPEYRMLYNDAYRPVFGRDKHPGFIGESYGDCWPTVWDTEKRKMDDVRLSAKANWYTDSYTPVVRSGYLEETYFTYSYSPLFLEDGSVGGIYATVSETTSRVIGERPKEALQKTAHVASTSGKWDVPFVNLYLLDPECKHAILSTATGLDKRGGFLCPEVVTLSGAQEQTRTSDQEDGSSCSCSEEEAETEIEQGGFFCELFREVARTKSSREYDLTSFGDDVPICAAWETRPRMCMVMPMMSQTAEKVVGILVAGVNPCHDLDENYRIFLNLFCNQVSAALASSMAREEERKRAEALEELDKAKTAFFSNISHEFRTPLTLMLGPIEIEREQLTLIHRNALRLYKLVNSLLDFSRIEAGRARAQFEAVDLASLTADLTSIFRSATERSGLELRTDIQTLEQQVLVDKEMWEKIVLNLISNALKFTMHGHIAVTLSTPASNPNCAELIVSDTGIGIPEEEMVHLGRRFHRVQTPGGRSYEGTGIGLALVYELVRLHGGQVEASSQLGKGTSFRVSIPFGVSHLPSDQIKHIARFAPLELELKPAWNHQPIGLLFVFFVFIVNFFFTSFVSALSTSFIFAIAINVDSFVIDVVFDGEQSGE